jgi:hypothetical protein
VKPVRKILRSLKQIQPSFHQLHFQLFAKSRLKVKSGHVMTKSYDNPTGWLPLIREAKRRILDIASTVYVRGEGRDLIGARIWIVPKPRIQAYVQL